MSDRRLRDPLLSDRSFGDPPLDEDPAPRDSTRRLGTFWGLVAIVAILLLGGLFFYSTRTDIAYYPIGGTTGVAPPNEPRPAPIVVPEQPGPPPRTRQ